MIMNPGMEDTRLVTDRMEVARKVIAGVHTAGTFCSLAIYQVYKFCGSEIEVTVINSPKTLRIKTDNCFNWELFIYFKVNLHFLARVMPIFCSIRFQFILRSTVKTNDRILMCGFCGITFYL